MFKPMFLRTSLSVAAVFALAIVFLSPPAVFADSESIDTTSCAANPERACQLFTVSPAGSGDTAVFKIYEESGLVRKVVQPYGLFRGNFDIAQGDVDGDGENEWVTVPERGGGPHVRVWSSLGDLEAQFFGYDTRFRGGLNVTLGDFNGDGDDEIALAPLGEGGPHIRIFDYNTETDSYELMDDFFPFHGEFRGGVLLATGDTNGDEEKEELVVWPRISDGTIKVYGWDDENFLLKGDIIPFDDGGDTGLRVRVGNVAGTSKEEIIATQKGSGDSTVKIFQWDGSEYLLISSFNAYDDTTTARIRTGVNLVLGNIAGDTHLEIVTVGHVDGRAPIRVWQFGFGDIFRIIAQKSVFPSTVRGLNIHTRNVAPDRLGYGYDDIEHEEIIVAPRGAGGPMLAVLRYHTGTTGNLEVIKRFFVFHPLFRGETRFESGTE